LDDALVYVSKWVWRYDIDETNQRLYPNNYYITFTPTRFSFSANFAGIPKGNYPYTLTRDEAGYVLKIADWTQGAPGGALKAIANIVYDPDNLTLVFTNPSDDEDYWSVEGDTFFPDITEYYASTSFVSSSYVYTENNIPTTTVNKVAVISFTDGKMVTSNASEVFSTTMNNKSGSSALAWAVVGKERKLIVGTYNEIGSLSVDPEKPYITLGDKKFAQRIGLCSFICDEYGVDCCPYINGAWTAVESNSDTALSSDNAAYFTIAANQGWIKLQKASNDTDPVDSGVYGAGLAGLSADDNNPAYGIALTGDLTIYDQASNLPLLTFVNIEDVDSQKPGNTNSNPNPRHITFTPAGKDTVIRLKKN
jgi:hypothetical protein